MAASQSAKQPTGSKTQTAKESLAQTTDSSAKNQPPENSSKAGTKATAAIPGIQMAPMFQGNPFTLKGLRQPEGLGGLTS